MNTPSTKEFFKDNSRNKKILLGLVGLVVIISGSVFVLTTENDEVDTPDLPTADELKDKYTMEIINQQPGQLYEYKVTDGENTRNITVEWGEQKEFVLSGNKLSINQGGLIHSLYYEQPYRGTPAEAGETYSQGCKSNCELTVEQIEGR